MPKIREEQVLFALAPLETPGGLPLMLFLIPEAAWAYARDGLMSQRRNAVARHRFGNMADEGQRSVSRSMPEIPAAVHDTLRTRRTCDEQRAQRLLAQSRNSALDEPAKETLHHLGRRQPQGT